MGFEVVSLDKILQGNLLDLCEDLQLYVYESKA